MGCYPPLVKIVSKALGKCNGRERWREGRLDFDYALAYPPTETHYMQPVARTVTFASNNSIYVIPPSPQPPPPQPQPQQQQQQQRTPEPQQPQTPPQHEQHQDTAESQPPQPQTEQPEQQQPEPPAQTQDAPPPVEPKPPKGPKRGKKKQPGRVRFGPEPPPPQQQQEQEQAQQEHAQQGPGNVEKAPGQWPHGASPTPTQGYLLRYTPSPLPRWEATPRRHEYFSGEYRSYYPTPVREGIYRIATDANRLTTIFSEENPNACTIV